MPPSSRRVRPSTGAEKLDALRWDERLLLQAQLQHDKKLAVRFWPRLVELVDYQIAEPAKSLSFDALWHEKLAGRRLDAKTWAALQEWIIVEYRAGRWWMLLGESSPCRPGMSVYVFQPLRGGPSSVPLATFESELDGRVSFFTRPDRYRIKPAGLEALPPKKDFFNEALFPSPVEAIARQAKRTAKDNELSTRGFSFHMAVVPGK